jgi:DNA-binding MarR family transcriptional regulator
MEKFELERLEHSTHKLILKCMFHHLHGLGLHPGQLQFLRFLHEEGGCTQTALAQQTGVSNASAGISVRRLEKAGFLMRSADQSDLRARNIELTEKGRKFAEAARKCARGVQEAKYEGFTPEMLEQYRDILELINSNIRRYCDRGKG